MLKKKITLPILITSVIFPFSLNAEETEGGSNLAIVVADIASGGSLSTSAKSKAENLLLDKANKEVVELGEARTTGNWMYLDLNIGRENDKTFGEVMSVFRLKETPNWGIFNQTSIVNHAGRATANIGFGARHINDADTVIIGFNAFVDSELAVENRRASIGTEFLTSIAQFRANYYEALSSPVLYKGVTETALDGYDYKLTYELPFFYDSDVYFKGSHWEDSTGFDTDSDEFGLTAEIIPNMSLRIASQKTDTKASDTIGSISFSIPLGGTSKKSRKKRSFALQTKLQPIRSELFKPVQRENRIKKKSVGVVTVSGF